MWKEKLWKKEPFGVSHRALLKKVISAQLYCGEKTLAALRKILLFHITFPYGCYFYK